MAALARGRIACQRALAKGVTVACGSDAGVFPHGDNGRELELLVAAGIVGARLYHALDGKVPVIGVAKTWFKGGKALEVFRGKSKRPLFVTAAGITDEEAAAHVREMHGPDRIPTLLRRVDQLSRTPV